MNLKYNVIACCMAAALLPVAAGCDSDDDNWTPGPDVQMAAQVYFNEGNPEVLELAKNQEHGYAFTLSRTDASEAASVPLAVEGDAEFDVPSTVEFAAGQQTALIDVNFRGADTGGEYSCSLYIPEGPYNSPYTSLPTSVAVSVRVANWELYAKDAYFEWDYYSEVLQPNFYADLYKMEGADLYRIYNFMEGYNLTFTVREAPKSDSPDYWVNGDHYIYPENGSNGTDAYGYEAWFFDEKAGKGSFPLYPCVDVDFYWNYSYLYTGKELYSTVINFRNKDGLLYGYFAQYDLDGNFLTSGYNTIYFSWE